MHKLLAVKVSQHCSVAAHSLRDEERRAVAGIVECCGVELYEFHVADCAFGAIDHCDAVACGNKRVGSGLVDCPYATRSHKRDTREKLVDAACLLIEHVSTVASDVGSATSHYLAKVVLGKNFDGEMMFKDIDILVLTHSLDEACLNLGAGVVGMVKDTKLRVSPLAVEVKLAILVLVEIDTPLDEFFHTVGATFDHHLDGSRVAEPVAGDEGVLDVFCEIIGLEVGHTCHATLSEVGVGFLH